MPLKPFLNVPQDLRQWTRYLQEAETTASVNATISDADIPITIARTAAMISADAASVSTAEAFSTAALATHASAADPHPVYTTAAELAAAIANFTTGTYTPTLTSVNNVAASTPRLATYVRVGNSGMVFGQLDIDPTAAGQTKLGISLPIASALTTAFQLGGTAACIGVLQSAAIYADAANDRATLEWATVDVANQTWAYSFGFQIL